MNYYSKSYAIDEEVIEALVQLKAKYGSVNKGLRAVLLNGGQEPRDSEEEAAESRRQSRETIAGQAVLGEGQNGQGT